MEQSLQSSATASESDTELPSYAGNVTSPWDVPPAQTEHSTELETKSGKSWLSVSVLSRAAKGEDPPIFFQCGLISGSVRLDLEKEELIGSVYISLIGRMNVQSRSAFNFLNVSKQLWSINDDRTNGPTGRVTESSTQPGKLSGLQDWPFSFRLPRGVNVLSHNGADSTRKNFRLPPSLSDSTSGVTVQYELAIRVRRGRLRSGTKLVVPIVYVPQLRPCAPSILRQLAYQDQCPLLGPERDPEGWKSLRPIVAKGKLFKTRPTEVKCTLSLARPLTYTRGTPLHLALTLECDDTQALDVVSANGSIVTSLIQRTSFGVDRSKPPLGPRSSHSASLEIRSRELENAVWWRSAEDTLARNRNQQSFYGEIQIPEQLTPCCNILNFALDYAIVLYPFRVVGFTPATSPTEPLITEKVEIVTTPAPGPRPRAYAPPRYDEQEQPRRARISLVGILSR